MEIDGAEAWREIRQWVLSKGPRAVIRQLAGGDASDLEDLAFDYCDDSARAARILDVAGYTLADEEVASERAADLLAKGVIPIGRRSTPEVTSQANHVAMEFLDWWAERDDNPGALTAGRIIETFGRKVGGQELSGGMPGAGRVIDVYRLAGRCWLTGEYGVFGVAATPAKALGDWQSGA